MVVKTHRVTNRHQNELQALKILLSRQRGAIVHVRLSLTNGTSLTWACKRNTTRNLSGERLSKYLYTIQIILFRLQIPGICLAQNIPAINNSATRILQDGAEPTDTFQMVIDNIWKQGKISETVCKYVQVCYLLPTDCKLIF